MCNLSVCVQICGGISPAERKQMARRDRHVVELRKQMLEATIMIQKTFRGMLARQLVDLRRKVFHKAATKIQNCYRNWYKAQQWKRGSGALIRKKRWLQVLCDRFKRVTQYLVTPFLANQPSEHLVGSCSLVTCCYLNCCDLNCCYLNCCMAVMVTRELLYGCLTL